MRFAILFSLLFSLASFGGNAWLNDFAKAKELAAKENRALLVNFTGSDWCGYCIRLQDAVFSKREFTTAAAKDYVLVAIDQPRRKKLAQPLHEQNAKLVHEYGIEGFPTVLLMDADGNTFGRLGYKEGGPDVYLEHLKGFAGNRKELGELRAKSVAGTEAEQAKATAELIWWYETRQIPADKEALLNKIKALDPDNKSGAITPFEDMDKLIELSSQVPAGHDFAAQAKAFAAVDKHVSVRFNAYLALFAHYQRSGDVDNVISTLEGALTVAPDEQMKQRIHGAIAQFQQIRK